MPPLPLKLSRCELNLMKTFILCCTLLAFPSIANADYVLYFYADWCGPCQQMKTSWYDSDVQKSLKRYVKKSYYKINVDKKENLAAIERYNVEGIPAVVITDNKGNQIRKAVGYMTPGQLKDFLDSNEHKEEAIFFEAYVGIESIVMLFKALFYILGVIRG